MHTSKRGEKAINKLRGKQDWPESEMVSLDKLDKINRHHLAKGRRRETPPAKLAETEHKGGEDGISPSWQGMEGDSHLPRDLERILLHGMGQGEVG